MFKIITSALATLSFATACSPDVSTVKTLDKPADAGKGAAKAAYETQVVQTRSGILLAGTMVGELNNWSCEFKTSRDQGVTWENVRTRRHPDYNIGVNPTVAIDAAGVMYAVCLSANLDYRGGVLDIARSTDQGASWTEWRTVPGIDGLPDKPWLAAAGELAISYSRIRYPSESKFDIQIELVRSRDRGDTWSQPQPLSIGRPGLDCAQSFCAAQGSYIDYLASGELVATWGGYSAGPVYLAKFPRYTGKPAFFQVAASSGVEVPITQFKASADGSKINVFWYNAHEFGAVRAARSVDGGASWRERTLTGAGTALAAHSCDGDTIDLIWIERAGQRVDVKQSRMQAGEPSGTPTSVIAYELPGEAAYIGGYQSLLCTADGHLTAFTIDLHLPDPQITRKKLSSSCKKS